MWKSASRIPHWIECEKGLEDNGKVLALEAIGRLKLPSNEMGKTLGGTGSTGGRKLGFHHPEVWSGYLESKYRGGAGSWMSLEFREETWPGDESLDVAKHYGGRGEDFIND